MSHFVDKRSSVVYSKKYIVLINSKKYEILSNLSTEKFEAVLEHLLYEKKIPGFVLLDSFEFEYTDISIDITLDNLKNYF